MTGDPQAARFRPLRLASRRQLLAVVLGGSAMWIGALVVVAWLLERTDAIELAVLITVAAFVVASLVLGALRAGRAREETRYAGRR
jgi:hypothetical protein